ncbi:MAG: serine protease [Alphaproteobacteria bacterium]|nr:serine protease [Alphaproteobacteria bacterium]
MYRALRLRVSTFLLIAALVLGLASGRTSAQTADEILAAVVRLTADVPRDAATAAGLGTRREGNGIVIDSQGLVLTIGYLMIEADAITLKLHSGKTIPAEYVGYDHDSGFGLVRALAPLGVKPMRLGDSDTITENNNVLVAGAGGRQSVIGASVVERRTFTGGWEYLVDRAIFTSPAHPDWGGAALINPSGELVGVGSLMLRNVTGQSSGPPGNMFVPINLLKPILADLISAGRASGDSRPWMGLFTQDWGREGIVITSMWAQGPAAKAGVKPGDVIVGVGPVRVRSQDEFLRTLWRQGPAGSVVDLKVVRDGKPVDFKVKAGSRYDLLKLGGRSF